jgi:hypothetical protein
MNINDARRILDLSPDYDDDDLDIPHDIIKKCYKRKALIYHPDKNKHPDAISSFREVKEAFDVLEIYYGYGDCEDGDDDMDNPTHFDVSHDGYIKILMSFIRSLDDMGGMTSENKTIFRIIMDKLTDCCGKQAIVLLNKIDLDLLVKIHGILLKIQDDVFHFPDSVIELVQSIIDERKPNNIQERIVLCPTLDDLFDHSVYVTHRMNNKLAIPLWSSEIVYDISGHDITVVCIPTLPENTYIESDNDIRVYLKYDMSDIWGKDVLSMYVGNKKFDLSVSLLHVCRNQAFVFVGKGIPRFNEESIYDASDISDVIIHININIDIDIDSVH